MIARFLFQSALLLFLFVTRTQALQPIELRTDHGDNPLGIDSPAPKLSWRHQDEGTYDAQQTAYRIQVASRRELLASNSPDLWDSGQLHSANQGPAPYAGRPLSSFQTVYWRVCVWDETGSPGAWSATHQWTMGALSEGAWKASWITHPALLTLKRKALGYHSLVSATQETDKFLLLDLGRQQRVDAVKLEALRHTVASGLGFPLRFAIELSSSPGFENPVVLQNQLDADFPNRWATSITTQAPPAEGRYLRIRVTKLRRQDDGSCRFALSQVQVLCAGKNIAPGATVTASDSLDSAPWSTTSVVDGLSSNTDSPLANSTLLLRRELTVRPGLRRALLLSCGLGHYELSLNGAIVGNERFSNAWTTHQRECLYETRDLTSLLSVGKNALGFTLAGGFYNIQPGRYTKLTTPFRPLTLLAQLRLEYEDGTIETIGTDATWKTHPGPITFSSMYGGEDYDARLEPTGWNRPDFDDSTWTEAVQDSGPGGRLKGSSEAAPPIRLQGLLQAKARHALSDRRLVFDLGQNASIIPQLTVRGAPGTRLRITPAELLKPDGSVDQRSALHGDSSYCTFTLAGSPQGETWSPRFFYHGARYLQIDIEPASNADLPVISEVSGLIVHSDSPEIGHFECSNELLNKIRTLVRWAQRSNSFHVFTDCPHRERLGWIEQCHLNGPALRYEADYSRLFAKALNDMASAQDPSGLIPCIAPESTVFSGGFRDSPEWGAAFILTAWQQYEWTSDSSLLRRHYPGMKRYLAYLQGKASDHVLSHGLGDWYDLGPKRPGSAQLTPVPVSATALYHACASTLSQIATVLDCPEDAARYRGLSQDIAASFNRHFLDRAAASYSTGSQTANALALALGLAPDELRPGVLKALIADIEKRGNAITTGDVGYRYLLRALAEAGRSDVIFKINNQSDHPGYGYQLARGCTSLAESWTAEPNSSQNHFMLGQITEWFYADLAGLRPSAAAPGFALIHIAPSPLKGLTWVKASLQSPRGLIRSHWTLNDGKFTLQVDIPPNAKAQIRVPHAPGKAVHITSPGAAANAAVKRLPSQPDADAFLVGSGHYQFESILEDSH